MFAKTRLLVIGAALLMAIASWGRPDPLVPVPYVEGVFALAATVSHLALVLSVAAAAAPVAVLALFAFATKSVGVQAVATYFGVLLLLAPTQATPVPLLGFGAGPILGYFLMASQAGRTRASAA